MRSLALLFFICWTLSPQAITNPANPTNNPNQINVTTGWLYLNKMHYAGTWSSAITYNSQDVVFASSIAYISLQTGNLAHTPASSALWWIPVPGGGGAAWGGITGTLSDQTDLNTALGLRAAKASNLSDLASASTARANLGLGTAAVMTGPAGSIVGTTDTQALTNKTLDGISPTIMGYLGTISSDIQIQVTGKQAALGFTAENAANKGAASGYASLDSGTKIPSAQLPNPTASTLGGVQSKTCSGSNWVSTISTSGVETCTQPAFSDVSGTATLAQLPSSAKIRAIGYTFDGGGSALTSGVTKYLTVPFACTISAWNIAVDTGTATVKTWKIATGTAVPTVANTISTSGVAISSGTAVHSTTVSDFTSTTVTANDIFGFNLFAVATATQVNFILECDQ